jgi:hypothetical protein
MSEQVLNLFLLKFENKDTKAELIELVDKDRDYAENCIYVCELGNAAIIKEKATDLAVLAKKKGYKYALIDGFTPMVAILEVKLREYGVIPVYPLVYPKTRINTKISGKYDLNVTNILIGFVEGTVVSTKEEVSIIF